MRGINSIAECEKYRYWMDKDGEIWEIVSFCERPTVSLRKMRDTNCKTGGAVGCLNVQNFNPMVELDKPTPPTERGGGE